MTHSAHVLGSGDNKINISQPFVLVEFNRKTTVMYGYPQVNRMQIPLRKRGKQLKSWNARSLIKREHQSHFGLPWSLGLSYTDYTTRHATHKHTSEQAAWQERPWGVPVFTPCPALAATPKHSCWEESAPAHLVKGRAAAPGPPSISREHDLLVLFFHPRRPLCSVLHYYKMRFLSQKNNIWDNLCLELK